MIGAFNLTEVRKRLSGEAAIRAFSLSTDMSVAAVERSREPILTAAALILAGAAWITAWVVFCIGAQFSAARWVAGRSLAAYQAMS
ncbi:MFS transporter [Bradyrhizobium uaiense]|uniref:MFS transporter n=1 Tax=Bradyrhizobium uaiense TaxID=2594946 RepID=UPI003D310902